tara:strand:+ start:11827 stop:12945 length:1119 start_codon:yes stop_codon:yes gene_type:complete
LTRPQKNAVVHIGHSKTGSSFLQVCFAKNTDLLNQHGWNYPNHPNSNQALKDLPTSGNGSLLLDENYLLNILNLSSFKNESLSVFYSDETLCMTLSNNKQKRERIIKTFNDLGFRLIFVMYSRNFFEHSLSAWGQTIKNGNATDSYYKRMIDPQRNNEYIIHERILKWIKFSKEENFDLKIFNYDEHASNLFNHFCKNILKIKEIIPFQIPNRVINKSLSSEDHEILRLLKISLSKFPIEYKLKNSKTFKQLKQTLFKNSEEKKVPASITKSQYEEIINKYSKIISTINKSEIVNEKIILTGYEDLKIEEKSSLPFSEKKLEIIFKCLFETFNKLEPKDVYEKGAIKDVVKAFKTNNSKYYQELVKSFSTHV